MSWLAIVPKSLEIVHKKGLLEWKMEEKKDRLMRESGKFEFSSVKEDILINMWWNAFFFVEKVIHIYSESNNHLLEVPWLDTYNILHHKEKL